MSAEKTYTVKYYEGTLPRFKGYEELEVSGEKRTVTFAKTDKGTFALEVPLRFALRLHNSDAFDIVGPDGKVPAEFAEKASPHGKPQAARVAVAPSGDVALRAENAELKAANASLQRDLEEAARDYDDLEKRLLALQAAQSASATAKSTSPTPTATAKK